MEWVKELPSGSTQPADEQVHFIRSSKLVVISAGCLGSPAILERSGLGAKEILQKYNVPCRVDLPGVGQNYMGKFLCSLSAELGLTSICRP